MHRGYVRRYQLFRVFTFLAKGGEVGDRVARFGITGKVPGGEREMLHRLARYDAICFQDRRRRIQVVNIPMVVRQKVTFCRSLDDQ